MTCAGKEVKIKKKDANPHQVDAVVVCSCKPINFFVASGCTPTDPSFYADSGHWYLSKGIIGINNISVIRKTLLNE